MAGLLRTIFLMVCFAALGRAQNTSLNGDWNFAPDPAGDLTVQRLASAAGVRTAKVPASWQEQFDDLRDYAGVAWYWRRAEIPPVPAGSVVLLRFGAVDYAADIFVNGQPAARHEGGFLPFEIDVTRFWRPGENQIAVRVVDPGKNPKTVEGIAFEEIPHGKQDWYVQTSGLWQEVSLSVRPAERIRRVHVTARADGSFNIVASLMGSGSGNISAEIRDPSGKPVWHARTAWSGERAEFSGKLDQPRLWDVDSPNLYTAHATTANGDAHTAAFGFRTLEARDGRFYLNGRAIYLRGALDQDFWPETIYRVPSYEAVKAQMLKAKELGLNLLRYHIKVPEPAYLRAADETGVLIWYDVPNWDRLTAASRRRGMETLRGMVERDWNHPSISMLTIINEAWGIDMRQASHRQWLRQAFAEAKKLVPGWLVVDNSPCCDNFHVITDVADFHYYNVIPDRARNFDQAMENLANRGEFLFSKHGDAVQTGKEPLVLSEFGNWGLPAIPREKPWWWTRDFRGNPITLPAGVEDRFIQYDLDSIFTGLDSLVQATQWHQYRAMKFEIESIRARSPIQGYVITELTDLNWEANGLMDMWRREKAYAAEIAKVQQDDLIFARTWKRNHYSGDPVAVELHASHYGKQPWENATITWEIEGTTTKGELPSKRVDHGSAAPIATLQFRAPAVDRPQKRVLRIRAGSAGHALAENSWEFYIFPPAAQQGLPAVFFRDPGRRLDRLASAMHRRNYRTSAGAAGDVMIASVFDRSVRRQLAKGGRVLLIANHGQRIRDGIEIVERKGHLEGNWITSFLWMRQTEPLRMLAFEPLAGMEIEPVSPPAVISGIPAEKFGDVLAGIFYGWVHSNVATLVRARSGKGHLLITTFAFDGYGRDPYATHLLDELIRYTAAGFGSDLVIGPPAAHD